MDQLAPYFPRIGVAVTLAGLIYATFSWVNKSVSTDVRDRVALYILGEPGRPTWLGVVAYLFQAVFGARSISPGAILRTYVLLMLIAVPTSVLLLLHPTFESELAKNEAASTLLQFDLIGLATTTLVALLPVQLLALAKTRYLLRMALRWDNTLFTCLALILEISLQFVAFVGFLYLLRLSPQVLADAFRPLNNKALDDFLFLGVFAVEARPQIAVACALTIFVTTTPLALAAVVRLTQSMYVALSPRLGRLSAYMSRERVEKEPIVLIGEFAAALVFLLAVLSSVVS